MPTSHLDVPGGRLLVVDEGTGPPIVLLHAAVADLRAWDAIVQPLVVAGYRVIRFDARNFGGSTGDDVAFSYRSDVLAVLDSLGLARAALVGNSRGGMTAVDTAIESPERVVAVVGVGAGIGGFEGVPKPEELKIFEAYEAVDSAEPFDADALTGFEADVWLDGPGQPTGRVDPAIRAAFLTMAGPLNAPDHPKVREVPLEPAANDRLEELRCPVLFVAGELDFSDAVQAAQRIEAAAPNGQALIWPDVAHMIGMEQPERLAATIVEFLAPLERWA
jgi:pimeloyl-ACP methyl ester carboxylesterase